MKINADEYTKLTVDRFEGNYAVCQTRSGASFDLDIDLVDRNVKEGDVIVCKNGVYVKDAGETDAQKNKLAKLQNKLLNK